MARYECASCGEPIFTDEPPYDGVAICDACRVDIGRGKLKLSKMWKKYSRGKWKIKWLSGQDTNQNNF